jgi:hypothetical protein
LAVNVLDGDGDQLGYVWTINGLAVSAPGPEYEFKTDHSSSGLYVITVSVSDRYFTQNRTWNVTVRNVNRLPSIDAGPVGNLTISETDRASFWATASDPDGDAINFTWFLDASAVWYQPTWDYVPDHNSSGQHRVAVRAFDGIDPVFHNWTVTVQNRNRPPVISNSSPETGTALKVEKGRPATFSVQALDPDGDPLAFSWKVNGIAVIGAGSPVFTCTKGLRKGANTVTVEVSDGNATVRAEWSLQATEPAVSVSSSEAPLAMAGIAALAIVIVVAFVWLARRKGRKSQTGEAPGLPAQPPPQP